MTRSDSSTGIPVRPIGLRLDRQREFDPQQAEHVPSIDIAAGWAGFADDGIVSEAMFGGAARWYVSPRISGGLFQTSESFASETFRSSEGAFTAGGGVRIAAGDHVTFGIDAGIGWETHLRVNALVGIRF